MSAVAREELLAAGPSSSSSAGAPGHSKQPARNFIESGLWPHSWVRLDIERSACHVQESCKKNSSPQGYDPGCVAVPACLGFVDPCHPHGAVLAIGSELKMFTQASPGAGYRGWKKQQAFLSLNHGPLGKSPCSITWRPARLYFGNPGI